METHDAAHKEVREGRSFNPDEFAIALEQVVAGNAPADYQQPDQFFSRTCFTRALCENSALVLRRLAGLTENTSPVETLVTQMGGGKTHMLTALWHLVRGGPQVANCHGVSGLLAQAGLSSVPQAKVAVIVGNAWDPRPGRETPRIDLARQLAGDEGVHALGTAAKDAPPGTDTLNRLVTIANGPVLLLFDELLNLFSRHRSLAEPMHAFIHNICRGFVGTNHRAAVFSVPKSQVEMTDFDLEWQDKITKVVGAVAKPLLVNDEAEISEVVRRRLFEELGPDRTRKSVARAYAEWCFERRNQLPAEWTAVDSTATEKKAKEYLQSRFESCYPFHPSTLSVFQRKWRSLQQFGQTRGTLAMLAQWISWAYRDGFTQARREPLITLGSAPLDVPEFRGVVLGQLGETRLQAAIETDIASQRSHAHALDADTKGVLRDIHRRVGATIFFESSGGQVDKVARLPELRFALGEPEIDTTSVDNAAITLALKAFFVQHVGTDGFKVYHKAKVDKAVYDRKASLDEEREVKPRICKLVNEEFKRGASIHVEDFPRESGEVADTPRLQLVVVDPDCEWDGGDGLRARLAEWTKNRGKSSLLYPGALVWCVRKPGRDLRDKVELLLAWQRVQQEVREGVLGADYEKADHQEIKAKVEVAEEDARDEVWAGYRYAILADSSDRVEQPPSAVRPASGSPLDTVTQPGAAGLQLRVVDLGAGHSSANETLCGRVIAALKAGALLNEGVGAGYIDRNWPPALKETGAWPLASLRQSFLNGALTRLVDPDAVLKGKLAEFVAHGDFGLASGPRDDGGYARLWFNEMVPSDEIAFEPGVVLLKKAKAEALRKKALAPTETNLETEPKREPSEEPSPETGAHDERPSDAATPTATSATIRLTGNIQPELWNRLGTRVIPKLRSGRNLQIGIEFSVTVDAAMANDLQAELRQVLADLDLQDTVRLQGTHDAACEQ